MSYSKKVRDLGLTLIKNERQQDSINIELYLFNRKENETFNPIVNVYFHPVMN